MRQRGSSIVEVVVMMVIMSISLIGIYSLVNSGQSLAKTADDRLIATNLAKEWLESIGALRDTFSLRAHAVSNCLFTTNASNLEESCYKTDTKFFLKDDKTLSEWNMAAVCISSDGWYSQEFGQKTIPCAEAPRCRGLQQKGCFTGFSRTITFNECRDTAIPQCISARVVVKWWESESLMLEQIFTRH